LYCFFLVVFLGDGRLEKGTGILTTCVFFFGGLLVFFWLAGVKGTALLEQRPGMQTFFLRLEGEMHEDGDHHF